MKILIADDHRLILEAVAEKLAELAPQVSFVQALSVQELLDSVSADLDLAVIDLGCPAHTAWATSRRCISGNRGFAWWCCRAETPQLFNPVRRNPQEFEIVRTA